MSEAKVLHEWHTSVTSYRVHANGLLQYRHDFNAAWFNAIEPMQLELGPELARLAALSAEQAARIGVLEAALRDGLTAFYQHMLTGPMMTGRQVDALVDRLRATLEGKP